MSQQRRPSRDRTTAKRSDPRERLLKAAVDVFGRYGFDGASTRMLADAAGVNLQAIPYYFGGKEGLYIAAAEHIGTLISAHVTELREMVHGRLQEADLEGRGIETAEARQLLTRIAHTMAALFVSDESEPWARFLIREQMEPTEAFERVYEGVMKPMLEVTGRLVGIIIGEDPDTNHVKLRTITLLGGVMVFRMARAAVLAQLGWAGFGKSEAEEIRAIAAELVASLHREARHET
ncbi:CerR family C-terminal domain-containing protein [Chelativorans sp. AA-79]|uniref:CerR family C-terminal domain-containing protein n=1 Tax=Chelativorans sp. AA-79 TaxID=3028735 RepID=UPI0023F99F47|nr:CerR family C-terminal domain-containing protein [Chelativorans sp. AA-79]WEX08853.1 CerR family C-terminal domain-containing protein [Chelativorans sp. AA-79]